MPTINTVPYTLVHVDQYGRVTSGANLEFIEGSVRGYITSSTVTLNLYPAPISSGTYGSSTLIPRITVNELGLITNITNEVFANASYFTIASDSSTGTVTLDSTFNIRGSGGNVYTVVSGTNVTIGLTNNISIPGSITASSVTATSIAATGAFVGPLIGSVVGNVVGDITGNQTNGNVYGTTAIITGTLSVSGLATFGSFSELLNSKYGATGVVDHNFLEGSVWYHYGVSANFTVNFLNVPEVNNRLISLVLAIQQGSVPYYPSQCRINGNTYVIKWQDGIVPPVTADKLDVVGFTIFKINNVWNVTGSITSFG